MVPQHIFSTDTLTDSELLSRSCSESDQRKRVRGSLVDIVARQHRNARWHQRLPAPQIPGVVSTLTILFGVWAATPRFLWHQRGSEHRNPASVGTSS